MNIDGYTQLEIEKFFDMSHVKKQLKTEYQEFFIKLSQEHIDLMKSILNTDSDEIVNDTFIFILAVIGNENTGIGVGLNRNGEECHVNQKQCIEITGKRYINVHNIIQALASSWGITALTNSKPRRFDYAMDIIAEFDGILWDLHKKRKRLDDGFTTITYARVGLQFSPDASLMATYQRFRLPLIELPHDWTEKRNGGYHLNKSKVTTNLGEGKQPQQVLDVLNKLQKQPYILSKFLNSDEEVIYLENKFRKDGKPEEDVQECVRNITLTASDTYEALQNKKFYFEWKYDFRGRLYSTGYDVNLQSDKYKKGALVPSFKD